MTAPLPNARPSRRTVLAAGLGLPLAAATASRAVSAPVSSGAKKTLLVLGGTRFLGPAVVDAALARGYEVTLFNRGRSNPQLYPELEKLRGDRDTGDLDALKGRSWDIVVDTSAYLPAHARAVGEILADSIEHYVVISTCSVYDRSAETVIDEESPVIPITPEDTAKVTRIGDVYRTEGGRFYGPLKVLCEQALEELMPGRVTSFRPGVIAGRDDPSDRLPYWVVRVTQGGEVLVPDVPELGVQFTDVRDLGAFSVDFAAERKAGVYNSIGFAGKVTLQELVHGCKIVTGADCSFTYVDESFLLERGVRPFRELPFWLPAEYANHFDNTKGIAAGMHFRPIGETIVETADWHFAERGAGYRWRTYGMQPERELELLEAWHAREDEGTAVEAGAETPR